MNSRVADAIFWIAVACCCVAQLAILRSVLAVPAQRDGERSPWRRTAEIAWATLPGVALVAVLLYTWRAMHGDPTALTGISTSLALGFHK